MNITRSTSRTLLLLIPRGGGSDIDRFASVYAHVDDAAFRDPDQPHLADAALLKSRVADAVRDWIDETDDGKRICAAAGGTLTIIGLVECGAVRTRAQYLAGDRGLDLRLARYGIFDLAVDDHASVVPNGPGYWEYDDPIVQQDHTPAPPAPTRHLIQRPDHRNNGKYQFVTGYTGGGAEMCVHLGLEEIAERCRAKLGPGTLIDDGIDLWWDQSPVEPTMDRNPDAV
jgi:hypothetical protein